MKNFMVSCCFLFMLSACNQPQYDYKTVNRQFEVYTAWQKDKETAIKKADKVVYYSSKDACKKVGQGWAFTKLENNGVMECEKSAEGFRCRKKNVQIECRKIKMPFFGQPVM